ncbi:MAG: condensation domain-containing protein, partial [Acidobacteriota bacterium]
MKQSAAAVQLDRLSPAKRRLFQIMLEKERVRKKAAARSTLPTQSDATPPASFAQERLWFLQRLLPDSCAYNIPAAVRLQGELDRPTLDKSLSQVVERHQTLRSHFAEVGGRPVQVVEPAGALEIPLLDLAEVPQRDRQTVIQQHAQSQNKTPYDLATGPLLRPLLLRLGIDDHALLLNMHHTVTDGLSIGLLVREMAEIYAAMDEGRTPELPELAVQYGDYAAWQRAELTPQILEDRLAYWRETLAESPPALELPTDRPRPPVQGAVGARHFFRIGSQLEARLGVLAARCQTTTFVTFLAALNVVLHRYSGQNDFLVGTPISGRGKPELEPLIGLFIDTVVLRADLEHHPTFLDLLSRTRESTKGALGHQDVGFDNLVDAFQKDRDLSRHPLFQVVFSLQVAPMQPMTSAGLEMTPIDVDSGTARFDLELVLWDLESGLAGLLEYNTELFDPASMVRFEHHYQQLLRSAAEQPEVPVDQLSLVTPAEQYEILAAGRGEMPQGQHGTVDDRPIQDQIALHAGARGDAIAIIDGSQQWTFAILEQRVARLARQLN